MSVVKSKRNDTPLKAAVLAIQLLQKTIEVCSSKNNFPIRKKWAIPSDLYYEVREYCVAINLANDVKVVDKATAEERLSFDNKADLHLRRYMVLVNIVALMHNINESTINSWIALMNESYEYFQKWKAAEIKRYSEFIEG